jgi:hypothetical protein
MSNINGGMMGQGSRSSGLSSVDFYRRVPKDLTEVRMMGGGIDGTKRQLRSEFFLTWAGL